MKDRTGIQERTVKELAELRRRVAELTAAEQHYRKLEAALLESEELYKTLAEKSFAGVYVVQGGIFQYGNSNAATYAGYTPDELIGNPSDSIVHPEDRSEVKRNAKAMLKGERTSPYEFRIITKQGRVRWIMETVTSISYKGRPAILGNSMDVTVQKMIEQSLKESEARFRQLYEASFGGLGIHENGRILDVNLGLLRMTGYEYSELIGMDGFKLIAPEYHDRVREVISLNYEKPYDVIGVRKDGSTYPLEIMGKEVPLNGRMVRLTEFRDITERKRIEEALQKARAGLETRVKERTVELVRSNEQLKREITDRIRTEKALRLSEERFFKAFNSTPGPTTISTIREGRFIDVNESCLRTLGYDREEMIGRTSSELSLWVNPADREIRAKRLLKQKRLQGVPIQFRAKSGEIREVLWYAEIIELGGEEVLLSLFHDITRQKRLEEAYRILVDHSLQGLAIYDSNRIYFVNSTLSDILGYSAEELLSFSREQIVSLIHPDNRWIAWRKLQARLEGKAVPRQTTFRFICKDGSTRVLETYGALTNYHGKIATQTVFMDVTKNKALEGELQRSREQLRSLAAKLEAVREEERTYIARELHDELGQSLTGLKCDVSWLAGRIPKGHTSLLKKTDAMKDHIDSTVRLVRKLSTELRPGILDDLGIAAAIEWQLQEFEERTGIKSVLVSNISDGKRDQEISTVAFRILQESLTNIIRHAGATKVQVQLSEANGNLLMRVQDNGRGITEKEINKDMSLGLLGMKERAALLGGEFDIHGIPGEGTIVRLRIPLSEGGRPLMKVQEDSPPGGRRTG